jgi:S1-C subfamily serine protease
MKNLRKILMTVLVFAVLAGTVAAASYLCEGVGYPVLVNGEAMSFTEAGGLPLNYAGRTMLPVRAIAEALGVPIEWKNSRVEIQTIDLERLKDSCVMIYGGVGKVTNQSSGVLIDYDKVLTCYHAVDEGYDTFQIFYDDSTKANPVTLQDTAPTEDAAILTPADKTVKPVPIGDSDTVKVGDKVWVVSTPQGKKNTVKSSIVKKIDYFTNNTHGISIDPVTLGGSSGGGVFNNKGELVGILSAGDEKIDFIIPINDIRNALAAS